MRSIRLLIVVLLTLALVAGVVAQRADLFAGSRIPPDLKPRLDQRLHEFVSAHRGNEWERMWQLTGWLDGPRKITGATKRCLTDQMRAFRLKSFTHTRTIFSTGILSLPLSQKWWSLEGDGEFDVNGQTVSRTIRLTARRYKGDWFFAPFFDDDQWEPQFISRDNPPPDLAKHVTFKNVAGGPLEIVTHNVKIDENYLSLRSLFFTIRNRSKKPTERVGYRILNAEGKMTVSVGDDADLQPGESTELEVSYSAYRYFCQGEQPRRIEIDWVRYADGKEWKLKKRKSAKLRPSKSASKPERN